jgi:glycolate oxidase FAD binding subunit
MQGTLDSELGSTDADAFQTLSDDVGAQLFGALAEFPDRGLDQSDGEGNRSPLVAKIIVRPSNVVEICRELLEVDPQCAIVAHAGNGVVLVRFSKLTESNASSAIVGRLRPAATKHGGSLVVLRTEFEGLTRQIVWGGRTAAHVWMENVKRELDPHGLLNPGRFVY